MGSVMSMILKKIGLSRTGKLLRLYDFNNLKAHLFYQMLETSNLLLLMKDKQEQQLNQNQLLKKYPNLVEEITNRWTEIQETYNIRTDKLSFENFLSEQQYEIEQENEMIIIRACETLMEIGDERYIKHLADLGIEGTPEQIKSAIAQIKAKYEIDKENKIVKNKKTAENDFYSLWGLATEQHGYFPSTVLLSEWCGIMSILKRKSEANKNKE